VTCDLPPWSRIGAAYASILLNRICIHVHLKLLKAFAPKCPTDVISYVREITLSEDMNIVVFWDLTPCTSLDKYASTIQHGVTLEKTGMFMLIVVRTPDFKQNI
jgi:hypothetical protein